MIRIIQVIDSLQTGGAERVAVNYANGLADVVEASHICVSREEGPLLKGLNENVGYICLNKKTTLDIKAIFKFKTYITKHEINIIHAHSSSFFIAVLIKVLMPKIKIIWHDHYGNSEFLIKRPKTVLRLSSRFFSYIFSVNTQLKDWSINNLLCKNVKFVKNFPVLKKSSSDNTKLNGNEGKRILCLANLREQKNQLRLLEAFEIVKNKCPDWTLHCVGKDFKDDYSELFFLKLKELDLEQFVYFYDSKSDISNILQQSNVGVLVSKSEGLPLALLEYGLMSLPVICTNVGQCGMLIPDDSYGILLENDDKKLLANSMMSFIKDKEYAALCSQNFNTKITKEYSSDSVLSDILEIYRMLILKKND